MAEPIGVPYNDVVWRTAEGQPFGIGAGYNGIIFGNLANIVDMEGPVAVLGNVTSYRGMSVGFGRLGERTIPYSPDAVRFLAGGNVSVSGALTVVGNALTAGDEFTVGTGSTYLIGKSGSPSQREELAALYAANGSPYWEPADHGTYYTISSYDVPRRIPAGRVNANTQDFFAAASQSMACWQDAFAAMTANGSTEPTDYGYVFRGANPQQNVFDITWPGEGSVTGNLTFDVPATGINIVRIFSGDTVAISTPLWGTEAMATRTLYVFMNARTVNLSFPTVIQGSVFAPQTAWNSLTTGGSINGNAALGALWVQEGSGFELHWFPFEGGVTGGAQCVDGGNSPNCPECPACPESPECPACPECPVCPACPPCSVECGVIAGCLAPNGQCAWRVKLCDAAGRQTLSVWQGCGMGCFSFEANADGRYLLSVESCCHYQIVLTNVGVRSLALRG